MNINNNPSEVEAMNPDFLYNLPKSGKTILSYACNRSYPYLFYYKHKRVHNSCDFKVGHIEKQKGIRIA